MYKKSITRIEKDTESSQAELNNPALQDIIATNHVVLTKKSHEGRLSRSCKAIIIMIILALVAIGIIILTLVLAHSRNALMAFVPRSAEGNDLSTSNHSRFLVTNQENFTTITNEQTENENWQKTTVILTSNNLHTLTTQNVHISSLIMRTQQHNEHISTNTQSMKPYPSSNTIVNDQSIISTTIQTTVSNQQTTFLPHNYHSTNVMTDENEIITTGKSQEYIQTSTNNPMMNVDDSTSTLIRNNTMPEETSFSTFINHHFNIQSSTIVHEDKKKKFKTNTADDDAMNDFLFS